jgi:DNA-binding LytR/AlgR family response regulator
MKPKTCFIIEPETADLQHLEGLLRRIPFVRVVGRGNTTLDLNAFLVQERVDLVLFCCDADPAELEKLRGLNSLPPILLMASHAVMAVAAFDSGIVLDYLQKPLHSERLLLGINRALLRIDPQKGKTVFFKMSRKYQKFNLEDILYFEAYGIYVKVFTDVNKKPYIVNENISSLLDHLDKQDFLRIHKSFVINRNKITSYDVHHFYMDSQALPIGISYRAHIQTLLQTWQ